MFLPDRLHLVIADSNNTIRACNIACGQAVSDLFGGHSGKVSPLGLSPDSTYTHQIHNKANDV